MEEKEFSLMPNGYIFDNGIEIRSDGDIPSYLEKMLWAIDEKAINSIKTDMGITGNLRLFIYTLKNDDGTLTNSVIIQPLETK